MAFDIMIRINKQEQLKMYRKYKITKTSVINPHNYLLETEDLSTKQPFLFHQILLSSQSLPSFLEESSIERIISDSENQNSINEIQSKYEFYLEQNLLQIRMRKDITLLSNLSQYPIGTVLQLINSLNLDFVISVKQFRSNPKNNNFHQSNANKFFNPFFHKDSNIEIVIPFVENCKIHYYDIFFSQKFGKNRQKQKKIEEKNVKNRANSAKKLKKKSQGGVEEVFNSDECIFERYINLIVALYSCHIIGQFYEQLSSICLGNYNKQSLKKIDILKKKTNEKLQIEFLDLLNKCLSTDSQYNTNIFIKECEVLFAKYEKMQKNIPTFSEKNIQKIENHTSNNEKMHNSKSFQIGGKQVKQYKRDDKNTLGSQKRLKSSKSLINLKWATSSNTPKGRSLKMTNGLFSKSKQKLIDKTNLFEQTWGSVAKQKGKINFGVTKSSTISKLMASSSNWLSQTLNQKESMIKLRNFKKGNTNFFGSSTPDNIQDDNISASIHLRKSHPNTILLEQSQIIDQSQLGRFSKLLQKQPSKKKSQKIIESSVGIEKNDVQTNTQCIQTEEKQQKEQQRQRLIECQKISKGQQIYNNSRRREIVNTFNFKYYEEFKPKSKEKEKQKVRAKEKEKDMQVEKVNQKSEQQNLKQSFAKTENKQKSMKIQLSESIILQKENFKKINNPSLNASFFKKKQNIKSPVDDTEIEQVSFVKPKPQSQIKRQKQFHQSNSFIQLKKSQINTNKLDVTNQPTQIQQITQAVILSQKQKILYIKHYTLFLKFYKENQNKIKCLPQLSNLTFIVNFLYLKTIAQHKYQNPSKYQQLINLLVKKQQKITQQQRSNCHLYSVSFESIIQKSKYIQQLQLVLSKGGQQPYLKQKISQKKDMIEEFYILTCESNKLLQLVFNQISAYIQTNKVICIQQQILSECLYIVYFSSLTLVLSLQRQKYYKNILSGQIKKLGNIFTHTFKDRQDEYINQYKKTIQSKDLTTISIKQQCINLKNWYQQYL